MWNVLENCWLLLTLAGIALVAASVVRQEKPEWGYKPLLVPLLLLILTFGLDYAFVTDYEAVSSIVPTCRRAAINNDTRTILSHVSPNYRDSAHDDKTALQRAAERVLEKASLKKIRTQSHVITITGDQAESRLSIAAHLNTDSQYSAAGSLVFVEMEFEYEKIAGTWLIRRMEIASVNYQPMDWADIY